MKNLYEEILGRGVTTYTSMIPTAFGFRHFRKQYITVVLFSTRPIQALKNWIISERKVLETKFRSKGAIYSDEFLFILWVKTF